MQWLDNRGVIGKCESGVCDTRELGSGGFVNTMCGEPAATRRRPDACLGTETEEKVVKRKGFPASGHETIRLARALPSGQGKNP